MSIFTKRGREQRHMHRMLKNTRRQKHASRELKHDEHDLERDEHKESMLKAQLKEDIASFLADKSTKDISGLIDLNVESHQLIQEMSEIVAAKEKLIIDNLHTGMNHLDQAIQIIGKDKVNVEETVKEANGLLNSLKQNVIEQRQQTRHMLREHQRMGDRSIFDTVTIFNKLSRSIRKEKKYSRHLRSLFSLIKTLETKDPKKLEGAVEKFVKEFKKEESDLKNDINRLQLIDEKLVVLDFREDLDELKKQIIELKNKDFPQNDIQILVDKINNAEHISDELHKDMKVTAKINKADAKHAVAA